LAVLSLVASSGIEPEPSALRGRSHPFFAVFVDQAMFAESRSDQAYQGLPHLRSIGLALAVFIGGYRNVTGGRQPENTGLRSLRPTSRPYSDPRTLGYSSAPAVTRVGDVSLCPGGRYAETTMRILAGGQVRVVSAFLVSIGLLVLVALAIAIGVHAFLAAVGHYAPWEQIWAG
jgi:hypothetical protein